MGFSGVLGTVADQKNQVPYFLSSAQAGMLVHFLIPAV
jgi:hypothetical protein